MIKMILSFLIVTKNNRLRCASLHEKMGKGANGEGSARRGSGGGCGGATECYRDENELGNQGLKGEYGKGDAGKMIHRPGSHPPSAPEEGGGSPPQLHFKDTDTSSAKWPISEGMGPQGEDEMSERMRMSSKSEGSSGAYPVVYAARQHTGARDALTAFSVAGLLVPFFTVLGPLIVSSTTWVYTRWGGTALAGYIFLMGANALLMPVIYSPTFKKVIFRPLMWELLSYVRDFKLRKEVDLSPEHKYIFCWHPHGRLFYGFAVFCGLFDAIVCPELGAKEFFGGINELLLSVPFIGNMLHLTGMMSCGRKHVDMQLKRGNNVGLIVGGVEEVLEGTFDDKDVLWLSRRKGFAKVHILMTSPEDAPKYSLSPCFSASSPFPRSRPADSKDPLSTATS